MPIARHILGVAWAAAAATFWAGCGDGGGPGSTLPPTTALPPIEDAGVRETATTIASRDVVLLVGTVLTPEGPIDGEVLVEGPRITCVAKGQGCRGRDVVGRASVIDTGGVIAPGLIDTHNHILFDVFDNDDWLPEKAYQNHDQWTLEPRYGAMLDVKQCLANDSQGKPAWCAQTPYGTREGSLRCEMDKWGELKGLIAGTTSIVGLPGTSAACFGSLARSADVAQNGLDEDRVQTSATFPPSNATGVCQNFQNQTSEAFLVHCGEGLDQKSKNEFATLGASSTPANCLYAAQTTITHGTAFTATEFQTMAQAGMKLTWSPASNIALYGDTTNIPLARESGVLVALGPDWSMGGSQNLLDELRFARDWDAAKWGGKLTSRELVTMATENGAKVLAVEDNLGAIKEGLLADLVVFAGGAKDPYDAVVTATPKQVRLVMVGGVALYGDQEFKAIGPEKPGCEDLDICGKSKFLCVATTATTDKLGQTFAEIKDALENAMVAADGATPNDGWSFAPLAPLVKCP